MLDGLMHGIGSLVLAATLALAGPVVTQEAIPTVEEASRAFHARTADSGASSPDTLMAAAVLSDSLRVDRRLAEALSVAEPAHRTALETLGPDHPTTLWLASAVAFALGELGRESEALPVLRDVLDRWISLGWGQTEATLHSEIYYANLLTRANRPVEADARLGLILSLPGLSPEVRVSAMGQRSLALHEQGLFAAALDSSRDTLVLAEQIYGPTHPETFSARGNVGVALGEMGRSEESLAVLRQTADDAIAALGPDHPQGHKAVQNLAAELLGSGRSHQAEPLFRTVAERTQDPVLRGMALHHLGIALLALHRPVEAEAALRQAIAVRQDLTDRIDLAISWSMLALALDQQDRHAEALPLHRAAWVLASEQGAPWHVESGLILGLGESLQAMGQWSEAETTLRRSKATADARLVEGHPRRLLRDQRLATVLLDQRRPAEALALMRGSASVLRARMDGTVGPTRVDPWNTRADVFATLVRSAWDEATAGPSAR